MRGKVIQVRRGKLNSLQRATGVPVQIMSVNTGVASESAMLRTVHETGSRDR